MIVAVFVAGVNPVDPLAHHLGEVVAGQIRVARIVQAGDETIGEADLAIELPDG